MALSFNNKNIIKIFLNQEYPEKERNYAMEKYAAGSNICPAENVGYEIIRVSEVTDTDGAILGDVLAKMPEKESYATWSYNYYPKSNFFNGFNYGHYFTDEKLAKNDYYTRAAERQFNTMTEEEKAAHINGVEITIDYGETPNPIDYKLYEMLTGSKSKKVTENYNDTLKTRASAEYDTFIDGVRHGNIDTAIESAYEISSKNDITRYIQEVPIELSPEQFETLLSSQNALDEIFEQWCQHEQLTSFDDIGIAIKETVERMQKAENFRAKQAKEALASPAYRKDYTTAAELGETEQCRESFKLNHKCDEAIRAAINDNYNNSCLNSSSALNSLLNDYSLDRISLVIASRVVNSDWDQRFSQPVKNWAAKVCDGLSEKYMEQTRGYLGSAHSGLVDLLAKKIIDIEEYQSISTAKVNPDFYSSDFQCEATGGVPTLLVYSDALHKAWLEPNSTLFPDKISPEFQDAVKRCSLWGAQKCRDENDVAYLLKRLGKEAWENNAANFPDEEEELE